MNTTFNSRLAEGFDAFGKEFDTLVGGDGLRDEIAPAVFRQFAGEEAALAAHLHGFLIEVVHELVNQREGDEFDLVGRLREFADEDIAAVINAAFGFGGEYLGYCCVEAYSSCLRRKGILFVPIIFWRTLETFHHRRVEMTSTGTAPRVRVF